MKISIKRDMLCQAFLKEVMSDLCNYNKRGPNQGKYELKPEYVRNATEEEKPSK